MNVASLNSRMLMQASSCAYKLLRSKKTGTGDGKLFSFIRKYDSPYHFRFSSRIHKLEPCVNGVDIIYHGDRLTKAHRMAFECTLYLPVCATKDCILEDLYYKHDVTRTLDVWCAQVSDWI